MDNKEIRMFSEEKSIEDLINSIIIVRRSKEIAIILRNIKNCFNDYDDIFKEDSSKSKDRTEELIKELNELLSYLKLDGMKDFKIPSKLGEI